MNEYIRCDECSLKLKPGDPVYEVTCRYTEGIKLPLPKTEKLCFCCVDKCLLCGESLDDATAVVRGPEVAVRLANGITFHGHALCAADNVLSEWSGSIIDSEHADKEWIARICMEGFLNE